ncbi:hypothetical protein [Vulgatibacter sp.]|uniref:hypothetical protein n=1 Tax=Vulgatibacter sp. TaxID=1971226 RepID=UPI003566E8B8
MTRLEWTPNIRSTKVERASHGSAPADVMERHAQFRAMVEKREAEVARFAALGGDPIPEQILEMRRKAKALGFGGDR